MRNAKAIIMVTVLANIALAPTQRLAAQPDSGTAAFDKLKSLVGEWAGKANMQGSDKPVSTSFRLVSDGSALLNILGGGTPYEMVTMFHMDGNDVLATHYCGAHNQPRFRLVPSSEPNTLTFEFKDATNLASPTAPHMVGVKLVILDSNHHYQDWTFLENGQTSTDRFDFHRKL